VVDETSIEAVVVAADGAAVVSVRTLWSAAPSDLRVGAITLACDPEPTSVEIREDHPGHWATLAWSSPAVPPTLRVSVAG
jgi:hypothetical protein